MTISPKIDSGEFRLMRDYIERHCGIHLNEDKVYLVETRLTTLMVESGCRSFSEFYAKALADTSNALRDKIVDAMTTNETLWLRDRLPYEILLRHMLPLLAREVAEGKRSKIRIWSSACSTGQEPYSIAMNILEFCRTQTTLKPSHFEIIATDISPTVLFLAKAARYDSIAIARGLPEPLKQQYFKQDGKVWVLLDNVKNMVTFKKHNLQEDFSFVGKLDILFCRNVLIYFSDTFKRDILRRMARLLRPGGYFFTGASESVTNYSDEFTMLRFENGLYYQVK